MLDSTFRTFRATCTFNAASRQFIPSSNTFDRANIFNRQHIRQYEYIWRAKIRSMAKADKGFDMELLFRALADRTRLRLLNLIGQDEVCVCYFVEVLKTNQPKISRHLAYLRRAGIVEARREGKWMHYRIVQPADRFAASVLADVQRWLADDAQMQ